MLEQLDIRGLGVIESAQLKLSPGFTAITGETGAGKTMVVTALGLLLGGRATVQAVRSGAEKARVEGRLTVPTAGAVAELVDSAGGDLDPLEDSADVAGELVIARQVLASGRSRAWLGGQGVPAGKLAEAGEQLVAVHGQSEQLRLAREPAQREALDAFGGTELLDVRAKVTDVFLRVNALRAELHALEEAAHSRSAERDELQRLVDEVEAVDPQPQEDQHLLARIDRLSNREQLRTLIGEAHELLAGEQLPGGSIRDLGRQLATRIERAHRADASLDTTVEAAADLEYAVDDLATRLSGYLADLDTDGLGELDALNDRLAAIEDLKQRQRLDLAGVLEAYSRAGTRLLELSGHDQRIPALATEVAQLETELAAAADQLSELRGAAAQQLAANVTEELHALAMPNAKFEVAVAPTDRIAEHGRDQVTMLLQPHPGSDAVPVATGASGGELSRIMLALEVVLAAANPVPTLVFDEIDAGVGGAAALEIGARLQRLAASRQVIVVTHLAQVAAFADHHVRIEKSTEGQVTASTIVELDAAARVDEMTRLLSGLTDSVSGREHAQELLRRAESAAAGQTS